MGKSSKIAGVSLQHLTDSTFDWFSAFSCSPLACAKSVSEGLSDVSIIEGDVRCLFELTPLAETFQEELLGVVDVGISKDSSEQV